MRYLAAVLGCGLFLVIAKSGAQVTTAESATSAQIDVSDADKKEVLDTIAATRKIVSERGVDELTAIPVNGTTQWISVRGRDRRNPILLFLHGGLGSPAMPADYTFQNPREDYFTVVQWINAAPAKHL